MEIQAIEYTCQELLATLQGPALQKITASPALLRRIIVSIENLEGIADYLVETEQRLYPEQAPFSGRIRRNKANKVKEKVTIVEDGQKQTRILNFVKKWIAKHKEAPTMRVIRNYNRSRYLKDIKQIVTGMVSQGKLKAIVDGKAIRYVPSLEETAADPVEPIESMETVEPEGPASLAYLQLGNDRVGIWWVTGCYTKDGRPAYFLNEDSRLAYLYGSNEYHVIDRWVVKVDDYEHYNLATEFLEALQGEGK